MDWYIYGAEASCKAAADQYQLNLFDEDYFCQLGPAHEDAPLIDAEGSRQIIENSHITTTN